MEPFKPQPWDESPFIEAEIEPVLKKLCATLNERGIPFFFKIFKKESDEGTTCATKSSGMGSRSMSTVAHIGAHRVLSAGGTPAARILLTEMVGAVRGAGWAALEALYKAEKAERVTREQLDQSEDKQ